MTPGGIGAGGISGAGGLRRSHKGQWAGVCSAAGLGQRPGGRGRAHHAPGKRLCVAAPSRAQSRRFNCPSQQLNSGSLLIINAVKGAIKSGTSVLGKIQPWRAAHCPFLTLTCFLLPGRGAAVPEGADGLFVPGWRKLEEAFCQRRLPWCLQGTQAWWGGHSWSRAVEWWAV